MATNTIHTIERVINYIETNIKTNISLDDISEEAAVSKYHLHRLFKAITNIPLMEYVMGRKLTQSTSELVSTNLKIIDIAYEYGFDYEQNYIRSFKKQFSTSPAKFRKERKPVKIIDKIDFCKINPIEDGIIIEPQIVVRPDVYVVGQLHKVYFADNEQNYTANKLGADFYFNHRQKVSCRKNDDVYIGLTRYIDQQNEYSNYLPSVEVSEFKNVPEGMTTDIIPASKYAVFKYIGLCDVKEISIKHLQGIYSYIFHVWLAKSGYRQSKPLHYENIDMKCIREDYCEVDLFIPIE